MIKQKAINICINVDVDTLIHYSNFSTNGVVKDDTILKCILPRMVDLFDEIGIKATFFMVANTLQTSKNLLQDISSRGHEIASHSFSHPQAFHEKSRKEKAQELVQSKIELENIIGKQVYGFRAPGYNIDNIVLDELINAGYTYDSSLCPGWYVLMVKLATRIKSKTYTSSSTSKIYYWESLFLSKTPFLWCIGCRKLLEIPITTTRLKKPFIGTVHLNTKRSFFDSEVSWLKKNSSFINYELHPIEVVSKETFHIAPWVKNIPGVGKMDDPWEYLKYRLLAIKALGDIKLLYQVKIDEY